VRAVPGGYRLTGGEGRFCSGIDHADWVIIGSPVLREGAAPEPRFFVIPRSVISEIVDDWYVAGMRGTGSKTIRVAEAFIPEHFSVSAADMAAGSAGAKFHGSPIYRMSWRGIPPYSLIGVPIGIGRAAVATFAESLGRTTANFTAEQLAEQSTTFARLPPRTSTRHSRSWSKTPGAWTRRRSRRIFPRSNMRGCRAIGPTPRSVLAMR
jgi:3-hydroxy-9,10-secoandrosta-1,3,5(10)-triene-9,17-dione monooxygenase